MTGLVTLLGYSREEAMKLPLSRLSFGNHQGMFAYMSGAITGGTRRVFDWKLRKKDASPIWTEMILKKGCASAGTKADNG
jgi:PAS domain-containing protein